MGDLDWPVVVVAVAAAPRVNSPKEFALRIDLAGYPETAPTSTPWNPAIGKILDEELRPKGELVGHVFRTDWNGGKALYAPFDRAGLKSHPDWKTRYPQRAWDPSRDLTWLLQVIHEMLNNDDYIGI